MNLKSRVKLNNGVDIPLVGLGVYQSAEGKETQNAVACALETGYRLIDTAKLYFNEKDVGIAVKRSSVPREEIFVTTKLWNDDHGYKNTLKAFEKSLSVMELYYMDLFLIHWPHNKELREETWEALEKIYAGGKCRAIGVSNFTIKHLEDLLSYASIIPAVNQVEFSPFLYQKELLEFCRSKNIQLEAYSPLVKNRKSDHPLLKELSIKYSKTPVQILLRWNLEQRIVIIPKSVKKERIKENADIFDFELEKSDVEKLNALNENYRTTVWDPTRLP